MTSVRVIGPGRAGRSFESALRTRGWTVHDALGRQSDLTGAALGTDVVLIATPDDAVAGVAQMIEPDPSTLIVHISGTLGLDALEPHQNVASIHPLMTLPDAEVGSQRLLSGMTFAVDGHQAALDLIRALGGVAISVQPEDRALYHAAAAVASNHLVALLAQVERLADQARVPLTAYLDLAAASVDNVRRASSAREALTGPAARNDLSTLRTHRAALPTDEVDLYATLSIEAGRLAGHDQRSLWNSSEER